MRSLQQFHQPSGLKVVGEDVDVKVAVGDLEKASGERLEFVG